MGLELAFLHSGEYENTNGEVTHHHVVLFDAFLVRDDFVANCTAETLKM